MKLRFKEGDFVKIIKNNHHHYFEIGETVMISIADKRDNGVHCCDVTHPDWHTNNYYSAFNKKGWCWSIGDCEIEPSTKKAFSRIIMFRGFRCLNMKVFKDSDPTKLVNWNLQY